MTRYCGRMTVNIVGFTEIQEAIRDNCPEEFFTLVMRRFMMKIAERIARDHGCGCLVTGENLGQVASQTMEAMAVTGACVDLPIFQPLIGMDKEEIVTRARQIGTMETSILPYEDCCTVFTPRHPKTKPTLAQVDAACAPLDMEGLIARALENTAFVAAVNRYGVEDQLVMPGHTKVCNPRGHVVAELAEEAEGVLHVELDLNEVVDYRQRSPYLRDRRPDLYDLVLLP